MRETANDTFTEVFQVASKFSANLFDTELQAPRVTSRQKSSANPQTTSNEEYFRVTTFITCIDTLIQNLTDRFIKNEDILSSFQLLLPGYACEKKINELEKLGPYFQDEMPLSAVQAEYKLWCAKISSIDPSTEILKLLEYCDGTFFRAMNLLLKVMATLPVTTASVERSFSTMKRIKTLPRSVMGHDRLSALAMMSIHWDTVVDPEEVLDLLAKKKSRKLLF
ncbi:TTF-type domain-containing protein [Trichonephila clavata]|uniref:TTF-type domain-containing protein n=1 Tax=Trichonephila clavata TaxID=2740835 RepID=A0A8X6J5P4_TRICU|nr:TTF-type domain-containing protein [Trichonephila clavata]